MTHKILILEGSPRNASNTRQLLALMEKSLLDAGHDVRSVEVAKFNVKHFGCIACEGCKRNNNLKCVLKDEIAECIDIIPQYDIVLFASPIYFFGMTAQLKAVFDRFYALLKQDYSTPMSQQKFALFCTGGGSLEESGFRAIEHQLKSFTQFLSLPEPLTYFVECPNNQLPDLYTLEPDVQQFAQKLSQL